MMTWPFFCPLTTVTTRLREEGSGALVDRLPAAAEKDELGAEEAGNEASEPGAPLDQRPAPVPGEEGP